MRVVFGLRVLAKGCGVCARRVVSRSIVDTTAKSAYSEGHFRSNAQAKIAAVPVIEVKGTVAVCDGGSGSLGHPLEYIQLDTRNQEPAVCKYCGLRYKKAEGNFHHH